MNGMTKVLVGAGVVIGASFVSTEIAKKFQEKQNKNDEKNPFEGKKVIFVPDENDPENADGVRGHLMAVGDSDFTPTFYDKYVKRGLDIALSFGGLVVLSPVLLGIAAAIKIDDPGPVFFTQKRLGENKKYFRLYKFRSMKMSTPHDTPTHMLDNPEQYITRVGKFLRAHSLDELPQLLNCLDGSISIVAQRPGLWNQDLLTAERDKYGVNDLKPGITGWAQINGRDAISIEEKAKLDGYWKEHRSLGFDLKCMLGTVTKIGHDDSVVEGGTGTMARAHRDYTTGKSDQELIGHIGFGETVEVDKTMKKKVLITGTGSYIGQSFIKYAKKNYPENFEIDELDMLGDQWKKADFSQYDIVYHVAGIAHADVGKVSEETKEKYYAVNTDLAVEVARKAKEEGVKEFIFMSSMIVYGDSAPYGKKKVVDEFTVPAPANFYGDSKFQADVAVREMADENFRVIVLRPPMIYGRNSKGNYQTLSKIARKLFAFPKVDNERSMLHIDNLCEFLCQLMLIKKFEKLAMVLVPQNSEWTTTSEMVREIAEVVGKNIRISSIMRPAVWMAEKVPGRIGGLVNKAFGNSVYTQSISRYKGLDYQKVSLRESVKRTEGSSDSVKKKVLFLVNHDVVIYNFRLELVERLINDGYEVHISSPYGERIDDLTALGAIFHEIDMDRHGMNPISELKLLLSYKKLFEEVKPDVILGYTIKPNIYGAMAAGWKNIPFIANITGLGTAVENPGMSQKLMILLYKIAFRKVQKVFFQNTENQQFFIKHKIALGKHELLPGSGVNLERFTLKEYPTGDTIRFAFISRIMKEKGIDQYLEAAEAIKKKYPNTEFHICGFCEAEYEGKLNEYNANGIVIYHGMLRDIASFLKDIHCVVHPTYYPEGLSNVLLEGSASGRPIITTDRAGCREVVDDGVNGFMIPQKNSEKLIEAIEKFLDLTYEGKKKMGLLARAKVERVFDRRIVVQKYYDEIENVYKRLK